MKKLTGLVPFLISLQFIIGCTESSDRNVPFIDAETPVNQITFTDSEPNPPNNPQFLGNIDGNTVYITDGSLIFNDGATGSDEFDSFTVTAMGNQTLMVSVSHDIGLDVDLAIVDPVTGNILTELGDGLTSPETISLVLVDGQTVAVEVEAFDGSGNYTIFIGSTN